MTGGRAENERIENLGHSPGSTQGALHRTPLRSAAVIETPQINPICMPSKSIPCVRISLSSTPLSPSVCFSTNCQIRRTLPPNPVYNVSRKEFELGYMRAVYMNIIRPAVSISSRNAESVFRLLS